MLRGNNLPYVCIRAPQRTALPVLFAVLCAPWRPLLCCRFRSASALSIVVLPRALNEIPVVANPRACFLFLAVRLRRYLGSGDPVSAHLRGCDGDKVGRSIWAVSGCGRGFGCVFWCVPRDFRDCTLSGYGLLTCSRARTASRASHRF